MSSKSFAKTTRLVAEDAGLRSAASSGDATSGSQVVQVTLTAGLSPITPADITAGSRFFITLANPNASTALGIPQVSASTPGQPGSFQVRSDTPTTPGTPLAADVSTYNVLILSP